MSDPLTLEEIRDSLRVGAPAVLATADLDGTPHISYVTQVCYLDAERVGTSRQVFNRSLSTLTDGRFSQLMIVSVLTGAQYRLDLRHLHTMTDGEVFDAMASNLVALAAGADADPAFRLTGVDVHRVLRVEADSAAFNGSGEPPQPPTDPLAAVEQLARRLERCVSYDETAQALCDVLEDAFAIPYAILFRLTLRPANSTRPRPRAPLATSLVQVCALARGSWAPPLAADAWSRLLTLRARIPPFARLRLSTGSRRAEAPLRVSPVPATSRPSRCLSVPRC